MRRGGEEEVPESAAESRRRLDRGVGVRDGLERRWFGGGRGRPDGRLRPCRRDAGRLGAAGRRRRLRGCGVVCCRDRLGRLKSAIGLLLSNRLTGLLKFDAPYIMRQLCSVLSVCCAAHILRRLHLA